MSDHTKNFTDFQNLEPIVKTLRFRLIPEGKTMEHLRSRTDIEEDQVRYEDHYPLVKETADDFYRAYISEKLSDVELDWLPLQKTMENFVSSNGSHADPKSRGAKTDLDSVRKSYREKIAGILAGALTKSGEKSSSKGVQTAFKNLFTDDLLKEWLPNFIKRAYSPAECEKRLKALTSFEKFSSILRPYWESRENVFTEKGIASSIPCRLIHENFPIFLNNISIYKGAKGKISEGLSKLENEMKREKLIQADQQIDDFFTVNAFNMLCEQKGIDIYNTLIGGFFSAENVKVQGFNELVNLERQQLDKGDENCQSEFKKLKKMTTLRKQILSQSDSTSFLFEQIENDADLWLRLEQFISNLTASDSAGTSFLERYEGLQNLLMAADHAEIYVKAKHINTLSLHLCGAWDRLKAGIIENANIQKNEKFSDYRKAIDKNTDLDRLRKENYFSLQELESAFRHADAPGKTVQSDQGEMSEAEARQAFLDVFAEPAGEFSNEFLAQAKLLAEIQAQYKAAGDAVIENFDHIEKIKAFLDLVFDRYKLWRLIECDDVALRNDIFYPDYIEVMKQLGNVVGLYNLVRNYLTRKPSQKKKFKLNFNCPLLAEGWSESKVADYLSIILRKNGQYYLGVLDNSRVYEKILALQDEQSTDVYERMEYNYWPDARKMIPKCIFVKALRTHFENGEQTDYLLDTSRFVRPLRVPYQMYDLQYNVLVEGNKKYQKYKDEYLKKTGDEKGHRVALRQWISFCIDFLQVYKGSQIFDYSHLKPADEYNDLSEFYNDVNQAGYKVAFRSIPADGLEKLVDNGDLLLFRLYNKDFSPHSKGKPNLHTLYWLALFSDENLQHQTIRLSGGAEMFKRPRQIKGEVTHEAGSFLLNRFDREGHSIEDDLYQEVYAYLNHRIASSDLSEAAKEGLSNRRFVYREATFDIVKDHRYTENQMFFHVPISFYWKQGTQTNINDLARNYIAKSDDLHIIGIDRGERHLLYYSVIDLKGQIVEQGSLNSIAQVRPDGTIVEIPYRQMLHKREEERAKARLDWQNIDKIKDLKDGYLSQVVHFLSKLIIKYNAIIVLENLNSGFKRGRFKVEKQVYQKFEMALTNKLNCLTFKDYPIDELGGVLRPWQLTRKLSSLTDLKQRNGIMLYVPASYTSAVDPVTGFVNLFAFNLVRAKEIPDFLSRFETLTYCKPLDQFKFVFDYKNFEKFRRAAKLKQSQWTVYSVGERIIYNRAERKHFTSKPTEELKEAFGEANVDLDAGNLFEAIRKIDNDRVRTKLERKVFYAFKNILQLRNSDAEQDYIISPVRNSQGGFFDSRKAAPGQPDNGDANGAYHIARKGLYCCKRMIESKDGKFNTNISNEDWFNYIMGR